MEESAKAPDALKSIGEVAEELDIPAYVLRFWETKFPRLTPVKCRGGRRYYRPADVQLLTRVKELLYSEGFTIKGARQ
ncbi:MAG: MerR family transcriptional regulator, partial [Alphaproteobacteria bacterium]|nr:MerR family transcriptional regulator [Alphaproteobacteria bacterium]